MTKQEAIARIRKHKIVHKMNEPRAIYISEALDMAIKALEQELLTDKEQRIFLAAMSREEKVCEEVDNQYPCKEPYEDSLVSVCHSIERKVKKALWA